MLVESDLNISLSLCDVCPASDIDDVANVLLASFSSRGKTMVLLKAVIEKEVQSTGNNLIYLIYILDFKQQHRLIIYIYTYIFIYRE